MPFSHHSHSGQFCSHATNTLEEMIQTAISKKMSVFCLTEHMPREAQDLYPGEIEDTLKTLNITGEYRVSEVRSQTVDLLIKLFDDYYNEAVRLREKYADRINILVGMEVDWIRPSSKEWIQGLLDKYKFDLFIGSVHHVHGTPIDYDRKMYEDARNKSEGMDEKLFEDYFDLQFELLKAMKPPVIGHFDLICLKSDVPDASMKETYSGHNSMVWKKISRNLDYVMDYGGIVEINSAALRKGLAEPYPKADICKVVTPLVQSNSLNRTDWVPGHHCQGNSGHPFGRCSWSCSDWYQLRKRSSIRQGRRLPKLCMPRRRHA